MELSWVGIERETRPVQAKHRKEDGGDIWKQELGEK